MADVRSSDPMDAGSNVEAISICRQNVQCQNPSIDAARLRPSPSAAGINDSLLNLRLLTHVLHVPLSPTYDFDANSSWRLVGRTKQTNDIQTGQPLACDSLRKKYASAGLRFRRIRMTRAVLNI